MAKGAVLRWLRLAASLLVFAVMALGGWYYPTTIYLLYQGKGQLTILLNTQSIDSYKRESKPGQKELDNLALVEEIRRYSVDSLGYKPTSNYTSIFNQHKAGLLWAITACKPYAFEPYTWRFPLVGRVSYKGFFKKELADKEYNHLVCEGYDVDVRPVSAWSTLGWLNDPLLSGMLKRSRGGLCNLLFHELFHATYYAPSSVDLNENLASFIAHKATQRFLARDTAELRRYTQAFADNIVFNNYMLRQTTFLEGYYKSIEHKSNKSLLKLRALVDIADSIRHLGLHDPARFTDRREDILGSKNAYFIDFRQYDSMQDSLERVFNKIYRGNLENMVRELKLNAINY